MMRITKEILLGIIDRSVQGIPPSEGEAAALRQAVEVLSDLADHLCRQLPLGGGDDDAPGRP